MKFTFHILNRQQNAEVDFQQKFSKILSEKDYLTALNEHIYKKFCPVNALKSVKQIIHKNVRYFSFFQTSCEQIMNIWPFTNVKICFGSAITIKKSFKKVCFQKSIFCSYLYVYKCSAYSICISFSFHVNSQ